MKSLILAAGVTLALPACTTMGTGPAPAPLAGTSVDNYGIAYAFAAADAIATLVDIARDSGRLVPGTVRANRVADALRDMGTALRAASAAQKAGDTGRIDISLAEATRLVGVVRDLVK